MRKYPIVEIEDMQEPFCGRRRNNTVPLDVAFPEIAAEWLYSRNGGWGPEHVSRASGVRAWWQCSFCSREYKSQISNRTNNSSGCPYCASKKVCSDNSLTELNPDIAAEWHPTKNKIFKVTSVTKASSKRAWWLCSKCKHSWECAICDRTTLDSGCPACYEARMEYARQNPKRTEHQQIVLSEDSEPSRQWYDKPSSENFVSLYEYSKSIARQWHPTKNGNLRPFQIAKGSDAIAWWKCRKGDDHEWQAPVYSRTRSRQANCPFCLNLRLSATNSLRAKAPEIAKEWHPTKNGKLTPDKVIAGGKRKVWWQCKKDKSHEWETQVYLRIKGGKCPDCNHTRVSKENCLNKDFAYIAAQLHPTKNGDRNGDNIAAQSGQKFWWICPEGPDHVWQATPGNRTSRGSGCPACNGKQVSITNCLATLNPDTASLWHPRNGKLSPSDITPNSKKLVWWRCPKGHEWQQTVAKRTKSTVKCWTCLGKKSPSTQSKAKTKHRTKEK